jgi:endonuclease/exonuclease/phosphatase family metal-dependent hydrolase
MDLRRKPDRILRVLDHLNADIVALQEADKRLPPRPAALPAFMLEEDGWQIAPLGGAGSLGWHGNAVLFRDTVTLIRTGHVPLPGLEPRGAVRAEFETSLGPVRVVGLHLGLVGRWRRLQVGHLAQVSEDWPAMPTLWAGDFNDWSLRGRLDRTAPGMRFLNFGATFPAPRPLGALDRIALNPELDVHDHGVHSKRPAHIASDHRPVWADLMAKAQIY